AVLAVARRYIDTPSRRNQGLRLLKYLSDRSPTDTDAYLAMADGFHATREPELVVGALQEALRHADDTQIGEVVTRSQTLAKEYPRAGLSHNLLGRALQKAGRLDDAISELKIAADLAPYSRAYAEDLAGGYSSRALARLASGDTAGAHLDVSSAEAIVLTDPAVADATARVDAERARGDILSGRCSSALRKLGSAYHNAPDDTAFKWELSGLYLTVGARLEGKGDDALALSSYTRAYDLDPTSATGRRKVAELSYAQGMEAKTAKNYDRAITLLEQANSTYRITPSYRLELADAYDLRGQLNVNIGELDDALDDFERGLEVNPTNTSLIANYASAYQQRYGT
ncbi:MAG: tetratricopeptide repeat protein, partial [Planctomycetes bacterium]|nr:tetratricopeptide repeat protein [Planctomycetota bacterium]